MSQKHFEKKFDSKELDWRIIYKLPRKVTTSTYLRSFQYKILNNILYLNEKLFVFGLSTTSPCSFCNSFGENITHLFSDCSITQCLWKKLQLKLKDDITLLPLTPQAAIFVFLETNFSLKLQSGSVVSLFRKNDRYAPYLKGQRTKELWE